jgi:hypothetical protein
MTQRRAVCDVLHLGCTDIPLRPVRILSMKL